MTTLLIYLLDNLERKKLYQGLYFYKDPIIKAVLGLQNTLTDHCETRTQKKIVGHIFSGPFLSLRKPIEQGWPDFLFTVQIN